MGSKGSKAGKEKSKARAKEAASAPAARMKAKEYDELLKPLQGELVALQEWVKATGAKVCIVFEGRDTAGKGGTIKAITERVSPRVLPGRGAACAHGAREVADVHPAVPAHFPAAGEVVIFDRSWYNRAGVERVMGFCTPEQTERFLLLAPAIEREMVHSGIILIKYWLEVGPDEQRRRLESRIDDPRKTWKLTDMDLKSYVKWDEYTAARDAMLEATSTPWAPWHVVYTDDQKRGRLNVVTHLLYQVPYEPQKAPQRHPARSGTISDARSALDLTQLAIPTRF